MGDNWATYGAQTLSVNTTFSPTVAGGGNLITLASGNMGELFAGEQISGGNIPVGSYITAISSATTFTISQQASATGLAGTATVVNPGVSALGANGYTTITGATTSIASSANVLVSATGTTTLNSSLPATTTANTWNSHGNATSILDLNGKALDFVAGGIMRTSAANTSTWTIQGTGGGSMTAGSGSPAELDILNNNTTLANATIVNVPITDNGGSGFVTLVRGGTRRCGITLSAVNTYTGGTFVDSGTLTQHCQRQRHDRRGRSRRRPTAPMASA